MKILNGIGLATDLRGTLLIAGLDTELLTVALPMWPSTQFLIHLMVHPSIKPVSLQFRGKNVIKDHIKGLTEA